MALDALTDDQILAAVKVRLGILDEYHDSVIGGFIADAKSFLLEGGVSTSVLNSSAALGAICRGTADMWNYGAGDGSFSQMFFQLASQLALKESE